MATNFVQLARPAMSPLNQTIGLYDVATAKDPVTGADLEMKRVIGYFTVPTLEAYIASLLAILNATPPTPPAPPAKTA